MSPLLCPLLSPLRGSIQFPQQIQRGLANSGIRAFGRFPQMAHGLFHIPRESEDGTETEVRPMMRRVQFKSLLEMGDGLFDLAV